MLNLKNVRLSNFLPTSQNVTIAADQANNLFHEDFCHLRFPKYHVDFCHFLRQLY